VNDLKKHAVALTIIGFLVLIKFIFIPIFDWQNQQLAEMSLEQRKLEKVKLLMQSREVLSIQYSRLDKRLHKLNKRFYSQQNAEKFKRQQQKTIEAELKAQQLKIKNIGWQTTIENIDAPLTQYSVNYSFSGKGEDVVNYILSINANEKYSQLAVLHISFAKQRKGRLGRLSARLRRVFYMANLSSDNNNLNSKEE